VSGIARLPYARKNGEGSHRKLKDAVQRYLEIVMEEQITKKSLELAG